MIDLLRFRQYTGINVIPTDRDAGKREAEVHMANHGKGKISYILQAINTIPLIFFGVLILAIGTNWFTKAIYAEVEEELRNMAEGISITLDLLYPGDYRLTEDTPRRLYKGSHDLTFDYTLIDPLKEKTGLDITLFYQDTRILTTYSNNGQRIIGTGAPPQIVEDVLQAKEACFYNNMLVYGTSYFAYYAPLYNGDGSAAGMIFVGKPSDDVNASVKASVYPLLLADVLLILAVSVFMFLYTRKFAGCLLQIRSFLKEVSAGNLNAKLDSQIVGRSDELGEIAHSALNMQLSLRTLIDQDALTALYNRRSGNAKLQKAISDFTSRHTPFCVALGDIDLFKRINDTHGHECGDLVLKAIADTLRQHMKDRGFAARWGGEEFLLVFEQMELEQAKSSLTHLSQDIQALEVPYRDDVIRVTMTFGLTAGNGDGVKELLCLADQKLYEGKVNGRNQIVC